MVYLVGAGPGDPGLVTVKGLELIKKADCIIYDRLSSPELLGYAGMDCERIYVGKADRHHTLPQEQINELLVEKAKEYSPFLYITISLFMFVNIFLMFIVNL